MGSTTIDSRAALGTATVAWRVERSVPADRRLLPGLAHTPALAGYVLDLLLALVFESAIKPVAHLIAHHPADADAAGLGQSFEARRDIDPVAEDVAFLDDYVAEIDPDAEFDALLGRHSGVPFGHHALDLDRAAHGVNYAGELDEQPRRPWSSLSGQGAP
jgi:hypothetical protein